MIEINIEEVFKITDRILIDVRSPGEYQEATIPGALNIPLLENEERALVGTLYKQQGSEIAQDLGLELVSPKLPALLARFKELSKQGTIIIFCWRGGMRSKVVCDFCHVLDLNVYRLTGGYKAYRRYINNFLQQPSLPGKSIVIHGNTGVGKTEILDLLSERGIGVLDLEGLASNRGSVFGGIGLPSQPSQKMFESGIVEVLSAPKCSKYFFVECESKRIGRLFLPEVLLKSMSEGLQILLYASLEKRIERLVNLYCANPEYKTGLKQGVDSLTQRLGKTKAAELKTLIDAGDYEPFIEYLLVDYYDPLYKYPNEPSSDYLWSVCTDNPYKATLEMAELLANL